MLRVGVAPCSPFSVSRELMREAAELARAYGCRLHTHLAENENDVAYSREKFGMHAGASTPRTLGLDRPRRLARPLRAARRAGIALFARTGTGVAHCPARTCGSPRASRRCGAMLDAGVPVGLGVDG